MCRAADATPVHEVTVSGHINEGPDLFAEDHPFPEVREGDIVALPNVGRYNASMTSRSHCMRGPAPSVLFEEPAVSAWPAAGRRALVALARLRATM